MEKDRNSISSRPKALRSFNTQVVFQTSFLFLTSGVFLSGLAIYMGASDLLVSYISMITNICGVSILLFSSLMERFCSFKKITICLTVMSKLVTLLIVLIPPFIPGSIQIAVFIPLMLVAFTLQAQTTVMVNNWMVTFIHEEQSGSYIAKRQFFVLVVTVILSLAGGRLLDAVSAAYIGFAILFFAAFLMAVVEVFVLIRIPDAKRQRAAEKESRFRDMIFIPMKCRPFLSYVLYVFLFYLMLTIADSFTNVYMMRYLELPYITITAMQMVISLPQIFLLSIWGRISDKRGHQFALTCSIWFFTGETFFLALSNAGNYFICIPIAFLFAAAGNSGFIVSVFNRRYELMAKEGRILYDNFYTAAIGLAFIIGPFIGGGIKQMLEKGGLAEEWMQFGNIRLLYVVSAAAITILQMTVLISKRIKNRWSI